MSNKLKGAWPRWQWSNFVIPLLILWELEWSPLQKTKAVQNNIFILGNTKEILHVTSSTFADYFNNSFFD